MPDPIQDVPKLPAFISWQGNTPDKDALKEYGESIKAFDVGSTRANHREFLDIEPNRSVRPEFTKRDYDAFRWNESVPQKRKRAIKMCMDAYDKVGIIRNVIDMMGDFGSQGINIVHEDKSVEKFYKEWFKRIDGKERSERFLNSLYRTGNVFIYTSSAKITPKVVKYLRSRANKEDIMVREPKPNKSQIPWKYNFLNPLSMDIKKGEYKMFVGRNEFTQKLPNKYVDSFRTGDPAKNGFNTLPIEIQQSIKNGDREIALDPDKLHTFYYKKDDWDDWANPMIYAILDDIIMLEKMRLADLAALDGAISNIRLWTLGDLEMHLLPNADAINKLRNILASNTGGGVLDLVWGPELKFQESNSQVYKFLGSEKYSSVLSSIYAGLGVPPTLTGMAGAAGSGAGLTNNYISLKTLIERLQYGRDRLLSFWTNELEKVRRAMGFRKPAHIIFDQMNLSDDQAQNAILLELMDRNVISEETVLERVNEVPKVERVRISREEKARDNEKMPEKVGPFHPPSQLDDELEKMDKQFEHDSKEHDKDIEVKKIDIKNRPKPTTGPGGGPAKKPVKKNGRPQNSKDSKPRKQRTEKPRKSGVASRFIRARQVFDYVSGTLNDAFVKSHGIKDLRGLTKMQAQELEDMKLDVFTNIDIYDEVTPEVVKDSLSAGHKTPIEFLQWLQDDGISPSTMTMNNYKQAVSAAYVEFLETN